MKTYQAKVATSFHGKSLEKGDAFKASPRSANLNLLLKAKYVSEVKPKAASKPKAEPKEQA